MKRALAVIAVAAAAVFCIAAAPAFDWGLPAGVAAPSVPFDNPMSAAKVELGRQIFYDTGVSEDRTVSCATCHQQDRAFADASRTRPGVHGSVGRRNPMGLANVGYIVPLTWADPALQSLEGQVATPLFGSKPVEMGMSADGAELVRRLSQNACYRGLFAAAFPEENGAVSVRTLSKAVAAFERTLLSFNSPYDREHAGQAGAMSAEAKRGEARFAALGCTQCHVGPNLSDGEYHQVVGPLGDDEGVFEKTGVAFQRGYFRTPSLRNVELTAPYLRDGRAASLREAILAHPADLKLSDGDLSALETFLNSLTDRSFVENARLGPPGRPCAAVAGNGR